MGIKAVGAHEVRHAIDKFTKVLLAFSNAPNTQKGWSKAHV